MDRLEQYRQWIQAVLQRHSELPSSYGEISTFPVFDTIRDHYQVMKCLDLCILRSEGKSQQQGLPQ